MFTKTSWSAKICYVFACFLTELCRNCEKYQNLMIFGGQWIFQTMKRTNREDYTQKKTNLEEKIRARKPRFGIVSFSKMYPVASSSEHQWAFSTYVGSRPRSWKFRSPVANFDGCALGGRAARPLSVSRCSAEVCRYSFMFLGSSSVLKK